MIDLEEAGGGGETGAGKVAERMEVEVVDDGREGEDEVEGQE